MTVDRAAHDITLEGRIALVTGAGSGIGRETAHVLARAGAHVLVSDVDAERASSAAAEVRAAGGSAEHHVLDVRDRSSVRTLVGALIERLGAIDVLVNNAGIVANTAAADVTEREWREVLEVNLHGVFWCAQAVGAHMLERGAGAIVNVASMAGIVALDPQPQVHYNVSKAAVIMLTRSLAVEWAPRNVRVNAVSPGYIGTELTKRGLCNAAWAERWMARTPLGRVGTPRDVANAVLYLASDAASFITGENVVVDGGYTVW